MLSTQHSELSPERAIRLAHCFLCCLRKFAVKYSLKDLPKALVPNGDMFLFVVVSRQTKI